MIIYKVQWSHKTLSWIDYNEGFYKKNEAKKFLLLQENICKFTGITRRIITIINN